LYNCLVRETYVFGEFLKDVLEYKEYAFIDTVALCLASNAGILPVSFMAFKAVVIACIALSPLFLKKVSISEKRFVFLHCDIAVFFLINTTKLLKISDLHKPLCHFF